MSRSIGCCRDTWCLCRGRRAYVEVSELMPKPGITGRMLLPRSAMQEIRGRCFSLSVLMPKPGKSMGGVEAAAEGSNGMTTGGAWRPREESSTWALWPESGTCPLVAESVTPPSSTWALWPESANQERRGGWVPTPAAHGHFGRSLQTKKNGGDALAEDAEAKTNGEDASAEVSRLISKSRSSCRGQ